MGETGIGIERLTNEVEGVKAWVKDVNGQVDNLGIRVAKIEGACSVHTDQMDKLRITMEQTRDRMQDQHEQLALQRHESEARHKEIAETLKSVQDNLQIHRTVVNIVRVALGTRKRLMATVIAIVIASVGGGKLVDRAIKEVPAIRRLIDAISETDTATSGTLTLPRR